MPTTILIVDDNALVRAALRQVLENEKLGEIVEAENGKEAVAKAIELKPGLIILDLAMPFLDGFAAAREIGTALPGVPILMHTLYWSPRVQVEALKVGVRKTVPKSDSAVLIAAVQELLSSPERGKSPRVMPQRDPGTAAPDVLNRSSEREAEPEKRNQSDDPQTRAS